MNALLGRCPVCEQELTVTRLNCAYCGTEINGQFGLGRLYRLDSAGLQFVETFIKNRGNAYRVGEELGVPYSSVRARLTEIIRQMGYEPAPEAKEEAGVAVRRQAVLDDLASGKISSDEAVRLLQGESA